MHFAVKILSKITGKGGFKAKFGNGHGGICCGAASAGDKAFGNNFFIFGGMVGNRKDQIVRCVTHTKDVNVGRGVSHERIIQNLNGS